MMRTVEKTPHLASMCSWASLGTSQLLGWALALYLGANACPLGRDAIADEVRSGRDLARPVVGMAVAESPSPFSEEERPAKSKQPPSASGNGREPTGGTAAEEVPPGQGMTVVASEPTRRINFAAVLSTVTRQNPQVGYANARIAEAFANYETARTFWLPTIQAGISVNRHDGGLQETSGKIDEVSRWASQSGLGMGAAGTGSPPVPGLADRFSTADAIFEPRVTGSLTAAERSAAAATANNILLAAAVAYIELLRSYQQEAVAAETLQHSQGLANLTAAYARAGQGSVADADRARTELSFRRNDVIRVGETIRVNSARLAEVLNVTSAEVLTPEEPSLVPIELVSLETPVKQLVTTALAQRPELAESRELVQAATYRLKREQFAPLLPSVILGISASDFGGGPDATTDLYRGRFDLDAVAFWDIRNLGFGERSARDGARARVEEATYRQVLVLDRVAREVIEARVQAQSRRAQIPVAEVGVRSAVASYERNFERIRMLQGTPLEVLQSIQALDQARRDYLRSLADYDQAQFQLYRALGCPIPPNPRTGNAQGRVKEPETEAPPPPPPPPPPRSS